MTKPALDKSLESIVGRENINESPALAIDELSPRLIARPGSAQEAAQCLKVCAEIDAAVVPAGFATWLECGNPRRRADVVISLERMNCIIDYSPADLTATVQAGISLGDFNATVMRERQWLPLDPSGAARASIGAIAVCASTGPLRFGFGTIRDYVIGLRLAHADGSESRSGGRVVKNVAGYDMNKLYIGSFGTLALITELIVKLRPLPDQSATLLATSSDVGLLTKLSTSVLAANLLPASVFIAKAVTTRLALAVRFVESEPAVKYQLDSVMKMIESGIEAQVIGESEAEPLWSQLADIDRRAPVTIKISVPLSATASLAEKLLGEESESFIAADMGAGIIRMAFDLEDQKAIEKIRRLRREAASRGGTLVVERAPVNVKKEINVWGDVGPTIELMKSIKAKFDPQGLLNAGVFVAGI